MPDANELIEQTLPEGQQFFTAEHLAELTGVKENTFAKWRCDKDGGPAFCRFGRSIRYPRPAVVSWLVKNATLITA